MRRTAGCFLVPPSRDRTKKTARPWNNQVAIFDKSRCWIVDFLPTLGRRFFKPNTTSRYFPSSAPSPAGAATPVRPGELARPFIQKSHIHTEAWINISAVLDKCSPTKAGWFLHFIKRDVSWWSEHPPTSITNLLWNEPPVRVTPYFYAGNRRPGFYLLASLGWTD